MYTFLLFQKKKCIRFCVKLMFTPMNKIQVLFYQTGISTLWCVYKVVNFFIDFGGLPPYTPFNIIYSKKIMFTPMMRAVSTISQYMHHSRCNT